MVKRRFTDEQEAEICKQYLEDRKSLNDLAKTFEASANAIRNALERRGVQRRSYKEAGGALTDEQEEDIGKRYIAGENQYQLSDAFEVSQSHIGKVLERNKVEKRSQRETQGMLSEDQEAEVCRRYLEGESSPKLGEAFGINQQTILNILERNNIGRRNLGLSEDQEVEVCRRYLEGENSYELEDAFDIYPSTILDILERNEIERRSNRGLTDYQEIEVCKRYKTKENTVQLAKAFGVSTVCIGRILRRRNIQMRSQSERQGGLIKDQEFEVCKRYEAGETSDELAKNFEVAKSTICNCLKLYNVQARETNTPTDTLKHLLDGTGNFKHIRECELYLYELDHYKDTHCKPGIAFDTQLRVDAEYGDEVLILLFATRQESYLLEQAVLYETRSDSDCPNDLLGWHGASEVRAMPATDLMPIILKLAEEMEELGIWEFAA